MRITLKHTIDGKQVNRELIVKIQYDFTKPFVKTDKDQYGRWVITTWRERKTTVYVHEYDHEALPNSKTVYVGTTVCDYHDDKHYSKKTGRCLAWYNALDEMFKQGVIDEDEHDALSALELNATAYELDLTAKTIKKIM